MAALWRDLPLLLNSVTLRSKKVRADRSPGLPCNGCAAVDNVALCRALPDYLGMITVSSTWITPLSATMSVVVTFALFTFTPPMVTMAISLP